MSQERKHFLQKANNLKRGGRENETKLLSLVVNVFLFKKERKKALGTKDARMPPHGHSHTLQMQCNPMKVQCSVVQPYKIQGDNRITLTLTLTLLFLYWRLRRNLEDTTALDTLLCFPFNPKRMRHWHCGRKSDLIERRKKNMCE